MKNIIKLFGIIALVAVIGFTFAACDDGTTGNGPGGKDPGGPQKVTYVSTDDNGNKYTLEIDESGARSARSAAQAGDTFKLTVEYSTAVGGGNFKMTFEYSGTVGAAQVSGATVSLTLNINGETITITIVGTQMTIIIGKIVDKDGKEIIDDPGDLTPIGPTHTHNYLIPPKWFYNETQHWKECVTCKEKAEVANHTFDSNICSVCNYNKGGGTTYSLDGVWTTSLSSGNIITITGSSGVYTQINSHAIYQDAVSKGYLKVGDPKYRNLRNTGGLTWKGDDSQVSYSAGTNNATGKRWVSVTITLSEDGQSYNSSSSGGNTTYTRISGGGNSDPVNWSAVSDSAFGTSVICGVAYGNNTWVAVDANGKIAYSADGRNWTAVSVNIFSYLDDVAYGAGVFVAVGSGKKAYSSDGRSWTLCSQGNDVTDNSIDYVNNMFIVAGDRGRMAYSTNGISWNFVTASDVFDAGENQNINGFAFGSNRIVGVCAGGKIGYSTDGENWTAVSNSAFGTTQINDIVYANNRFVAVGAGGKAAYSTNGASWTAISDSAFGTTTINGIAYGNNRYVAVGESGRIAYSTDGAVWSAVASSAFGTSTINAVAYGNGRFVAVGESGKIAYADW